MARRRPRTNGAHFQQRRSSQPAAAGAPSPSGLSSHDARVLAERVAEDQHRYRVCAIRLLPSGSCGVIVLDSTTGREHLLEEPAQWQRLRAE